MNGYTLLRSWYDFKFENPDLTNHVQSDLFCYIIDRWNRLGQKNKIGLPTMVTMEDVGIKSRETYYKTLTNLIEFGFIEMVSEATNQHTSRVIRLSKKLTSKWTSNDQAHVQASGQAEDTYIKQVNKGTNKQYIYSMDTETQEEEEEEKEQEKKKGKPPIEKFIPPTQDEVIKYFIEKGYSGAAGKKAWEYYELGGWKDSKGNRVKNWKQKVYAVWMKDENKDKNKATVDDIYKNVVNYGTL